MAHRLWECVHPALAEARRRLIPGAIVAQARDGIARGLSARWERALFPVQVLPFVGKGSFDTFHWTVMPEGGAAEGTFYPDGSKCGGRDPLLASYGLAFVTRDVEGNVVAAAHGRPP